MWQSIWKRYRPYLIGAGRSGHALEPAGMGVDIGLEATLEPTLPPLFDVGADRQGGATIGPFGTDRRSERSAAG